MGIFDFLFSKKRKNGTSTINDNVTLNKVNNHSIGKETINNDTNNNNIAISNSIINVPNKGDTDNSNDTPVKYDFKNAKKMEKHAEKNVNSANNEESKDLIRKIKDGEPYTVEYLYHKCVFFKDHMDFYSGFEKELSIFFDLSNISEWTLFDIKTNYDYNLNIFNVIIYYKADWSFEYPHHKKISIDKSDIEIVEIIKDYLKQLIVERQKIIDKDNEKQKQKELNAKNNNVDVIYLTITSKVFESISNKFISIDVETTGLYDYIDKIIEIGATTFENGVVINSFSSLINPEKQISSAASRVNHITNEMIKNAPKEEEIVKKLVEYLGEALHGDIILCAHNATFDMGFITKLLERNGYSGTIKCIDTLKLSKQLIPQSYNYKQQTIAEHFGLKVENTHRAGNDSKICGEILINLLKIINTKKEKYLKSADKQVITYEERQICAVLQNIIVSNFLSTDLLGFRKLSSGEISMDYFYSIVKFKISKAGKYIEIPNDFPKSNAFKKEKGRLFFNNPRDIELLSNYILKQYKISYKGAWDYLSYHPRYKDLYLSDLAMQNAISKNEILILLEENDEFYSKQLESISSKLMIDEKLYSKYKRKPIENIKHLNNWIKGFENGKSLYLQGKEKQKSFLYEEAIEMYDQARTNGYCDIDLYLSYSEVFDILKNYDDALLILIEGIIRCTKLGINVDVLYTKFNKAKDKRIKSKSKEEKAIQKAQLSLNKEVNIPFNSKKVVQYDKDMNQIQVYNSIKEAARTLNIAPKGIREVANGRQKQAGGFIWKFEDDYAKENN